MKSGIIDTAKDHNQEGNFFYDDKLNEVDARQIAPITPPVYIQTPISVLHPFTAFIFQPVFDDFVSNGI